MNAQMLLQYFASSASDNITGVALLSTSVMGGSWAYIDSSGNTVSRNSTCFNAHPVFGGIADVVIDGQYMVKIPKFYYKRGVVSGGTNNGKEAWWISDKPVDGYVVHPAFTNYGAEKDFVYIGKYQGHISSYKLCSLPGYVPTFNTPNEIINYAGARNVSGVTGFMSYSYRHLAAIQWLYLVENATMDSQTKTGAGRVQAASYAANNASDVAQAAYRGIVGLWGNMPALVNNINTIYGVDAINVEGITVKISISGYPTSFMSSTLGDDKGLDAYFIPKTQLFSGTVLCPDKMYISANAQVTTQYSAFGGGYTESGNAGLWCKKNENFADQQVGCGRLAKYD